MGKPTASLGPRAAPAGRAFVLAALAAALLAAGGSAGPLAAQEPDAAGADAREEPPIGLIEFFGLRTLDEEEVRAGLGLPPEPEGAPATEPVMERSELPVLAVRLAALPGVAEARMETVCCHEGRAILFIGIREEGTEPSVEARRGPAGTARLPEGLLREYREMVRELVEAEGGTGPAAAPDREPAGAGEVSGAPARAEAAEPSGAPVDSLARAYRPRFAALAERHLPTLVEVLAEGAEPEERAIAALLLSHAPTARKTEAAAELALAMSDPDLGVRENAARSLAAIAHYAREHPEAGIRVPVEPVADLLGSTQWRDRASALALLVYLAPPGADEVLAGLRRDAWPELAEMAQWRSPGHALPAFLLLGRIAGLTDDEALAAWREGRREEVIRRAAPAP